MAVFAQDHNASKAATNNTDPKVSKKFVDCTSTNNYLQKSLSTPALALVTAAFKIKKIEEWSPLSRCLYARLKSRSGKAVHCESETSEPVESPQACLSPELMATLRTSFAKIALCMEVDLKSYFAILNHEAMFSPNSIGSSADLGPAQLYTPHLDDINKRLVPKLRKITKPGCRSVQDIANSPIQAENICSAIAPPANPLKNLVYGALIFQGKQKYVAQHVDEWNLSFKKIAPNAVDVDKIKKDLFLYAYNGGEGGVTPVYLLFLQSMNEQGVRVTHENFSAQFPFFLKNYYGAGSAGPVKMKIVSQYLSKVNEDLAIVEKRAGGACL